MKTQWCACLLFLLAISPYAGGDEMSALLDRLDAIEQSPSRVIRSSGMTVEGFRSAFNAAARATLPQVAVGKCVDGKPGRSGVVVSICNGRGYRAAINIGSVGGKVTDAALLVDASALPSMLDVPRSAGLLLLAARGGGLAGNHFDVAAQLATDVIVNGADHACRADADSGGTICLSTTDRRIYSVDFQY